MFVCLPFKQNFSSFSSSEASVNGAQEFLPTWRSSGRRLLSIGNDSPKSNFPPRLENSKSNGDCDRKLRVDLIAFAFLLSHDFVSRLDGRNDSDDESDSARNVEVE